MTDQDKEELKTEIEHIFDSGANELRIQEMVELFIAQRGGLKNPTPIPEEKSTYKITYGSSGFGQGTSVEVHDFTPSELKEHIRTVGDNLGHPMLDLWVKDVKKL